MVNPGRSQRAVYLHTWSSRMRLHAPRLLRLFTLVLIFVLFAPVQAAGRQNVEVVWSNDAPLGGYQLGDFDGDGKTDLFRIVSGTQWQYSSGGMSAWIDLANDAAPQAELRFGDFDGNGMTDVFHALGNQWRYRPGGSGAWANLWIDPDNTPYADLRFGDFNGDGRTDVFSRANTGQWRFSAGGLSAWANLNMDATPLADLRFGYFDNDDIIDIFTRLGDGSWIYSSGGVAPWTMMLNGAAEIPYSEMALGDFNGDGTTDIFSRTNVGQWQYSSGGVDGWFPLQSDPTPFADLRFGDFDGDGITDVFSIGPGNQPRFSSGGATGWQPLTPMMEPTPMPPGPAVTDIASLAFGDFNNDGVTDVFRSNGGQWQYSASGVGEWQNLNSDPLPLSQLRFGNFGGDARTDVFSVDGSGQWRWSDGGVGSWQTINTDTLTIEQIRFGFFSLPADNITDVFSRADTGDWRFRAGGVGAWDDSLEMDALPLDALAFGDFDGDGVTDIFSIDPMTGRGRYSPDARLPWVNLDVQGIALNLLRFGDFNNDGRTDIFTRADSGQWRYLSAGRLPWINLQMDPLSINDLRFGDFNGDGFTDVFSIGPDGRWRYSNGGLTLWIPLGPPSGPTATFTPTGTGSPTPTFTPTPTGSTTPSPTPAGCFDTLFNGDFEANGGWIFGDSPVPGKYTGAFKQSGLRSVQLGITPDDTNVQSYSSIRQLISVPGNAATVTLRWWQWAFSDEGANANPGANQDRFEIIALTPGGDTLTVIHRTRRNDGGWQQAMVDVSELAGKSFYLYLNLYNDGHGGRSWIFVDNMMLEVCPGSGPMMGGGQPWGGQPGGMPGGGCNMPCAMPNCGGWEKPGKGPHKPCMPMTETPTPTATATMTTTETPTPTMTPTITPTVTVTPTLIADLSLTKSVVPTTTMTGNQVVFTLIITNSGPLSTTGVTVSDDLREGLVFVSSSGAYSDVTTMWTIGDLAAGMTSTLQITAMVQVTTAGSIINYAEVYTSTAPDDSTPGNGSSDEDDDDTVEIQVIDEMMSVEPPIGIAPQALLPQAAPQAVDTPAPNAAIASECVELIANGGFETGTGWNMLQGPAAPTYTTEQTFNGSGQAMLLGIVNGDNLASISAIDQMIALPEDASSIILSFRYFPLYEDEPGPGDLQYVDMYNVLTGQFAGRALGTQANDRTWLTADYDMTMQAGQTVRLVMAVNNDGVQGRSAMVVDNVSVISCNFGDLVNPAIVPTPDPSLGVSNRQVSEQPTVLLAGRESEAANNTWLARLSAMGVLASVAGVIAFAVMVVIGTLRQT